MAPQPSSPTVRDEAPSTEDLTDYDRLHFKTYIRLLDADAARACHAEMSRIILGIDPQAEPERAAKAVESHLRRARWMTTHGYRKLLNS